jgi:hypothetical protein
MLIALMLVAGLVALYFGAECLVRGGASLEGALLLAGYGGYLWHLWPKS